MKKLFKHFRLRSETLDIIDQANSIIEEYQADGFDLTLRQLYYQFVARDLIANNATEYGKLGRIINKGRLAGLVDWDAIKDRGRSMYQNGNWENPQDIVNSCARCFALDSRLDQETYIEVWVEKEALIDVLE